MWSDITVHILRTEACQPCRVNSFKPLVLKIQNKCFHWIFLLLIDLEGIGDRLSLEDILGEDIINCFFVEWSCVGISTTVL